MKLVRNLLSSVSLAVMATLLLSSAVAPVWAQTGSLGTMVGLVTDQSGAVVPDVTVTITDTATKASRTATTNSA